MPDPTTNVPSLREMMVQLEEIEARRAADRRELDDALAAAERPISAQMRDEAAQPTAADFWSTEPNDPEPAGPLVPDCVCDHCVREQRRHDEWAARQREWATQHNHSLPEPDGPEIAVQPEVMPDRRRPLVFSERLRSARLMAQQGNDGGIRYRDSDPDEVEEPLIEPRPVKVCDRCGISGYLSSEMFATERTNTCVRCTANVKALRQDIRRRGRKFGVEIEFTLTNEDPLYGEEAVDANYVADALEDAGITCYNDGYTHQVTDCWKIVPDGSLSYGWELVSPPLHWDERDQITTVCKVLSELGARATRQCGLHVHHEITDLSLPAFKRLVKNWHNAQDLTDQLVSRARRGRNAEWCGRLRNTEVQWVDECASLYQLRECYVDRYRALNVECYGRYGTVEIRQHQGTINAKKIIAWIAYGQALVKTATRRMRPHVENVNAYLDDLPFMDDEHREYLKNRAEQLATVAGSNSDERYDN